MSEVSRNPRPRVRQDADVERERRRVASRAAPRERVLVERPGALVRRRAVFGHRGSSSREERKRSTIDGCERVRAAVTGVRARRVPAGTPQAWHTSHVRCRQAMGPRQWSSTCVQRSTGRTAESRARYNRPPCRAWVDRGQSEPGSLGVCHEAPRGCDLVRSVTLAGEGGQAECAARLSAGAWSRSSRP